MGKIKRASLMIVAVLCVASVIGLAYAQVELTGDQSGIILGGIPSNSTFGEMYLINETAGYTLDIPSDGVFYNVTNFSVGDLQDVTFSSDRFLTIEREGIYKIDYSISFSGGGNNLYGVTVLVNGVPQEDFYIHRKLGTGGDVGNAGGTGLISLAVDDVLHLGIEDETNPASDATVYTANLNAHKLEIIDTQTIINNTGGTFDNTNIAYLNNTQTFTGFNTFNENISLGGTDCLRFGTKAFICGFGTGDLRLFSDDQFEIWNTKATGVINITANNLTYNNNELCTAVNGLCEEGTTNIFNQSLNTTDAPTFLNLSLTQDSLQIVLDSDATFGTTTLTDNTGIGDALITLPKSTSTISANQLADTLSVPDTFSGTSNSLYMAQCIEHQGDRDNTICFSGTDEQEFTLTGGATYLSADRLGGKTNVHFDVYGIDFTVGSGDFRVDQGESYFYEYIGLNMSAGREHPIDMGGHFNARDQYFYAYDNTGGRTLGASWVNINFDTEVRRDNIFSAFDGENLTVDLSSGSEDVFDYRIEVDASTDVSSGSGRSTSVFRVLKNGVEISGSKCWIYNRISTQGEGSCTINLIEEASDGDIFRVQGMRNAGTDTIVTLADGMRFNVQKI